MKTVQAAHDALQALRTNRSIPLALSAAHSALNKLLNNLNSLAASPEVLANSHAFDTFIVTLPTGISFSDALVLDMTAVAGRLKFMTPPDSKSIVGDLDNQECRDIAGMVDCYDRSVSSVLTQHGMCVRRVGAVLIVTDIL
jgi:hypothetical protein